MRAGAFVPAMSAGVFWFALATAVEPAGSCSAKRSSSTLAITADGEMLLVVNPDSNSLTLVDTTGLTKIAEVSTGTDPRAVAVDDARNRAYVANRGTDSISVIDLKAHLAITDVPVGNRPVAVAVSRNGCLIAVAELGDHTVRLLDATNLSTIARIAVADRPHGLTFNLDGRLLVSHLLSGNVTVLPIQSDNGESPPAGAASPAETRCLPGTGAGNWTGAMTAQTLVSTITTWPNVAPSPAITVNAAGTRAYIPQTMAHGLGLNTQFDNTVFPKLSVLNLETNSHQTSEHISLPEKDQPVGLPWDAALTRNDTELWVVNAASNDVSVLNISTPVRTRRVAHIRVGHNPRGIVISPDGKRAFVNNTLAGTVSVIDAGTYIVTTTVTVTDIPLPPSLLKGKQLFFSSARGDLAQASWISCNTCHIEGEHDGRTWLLPYIGTVPPGAASTIKRNTTSLLGMVETYPLRWSAEWDESADSEFSIRFEQFGTGLIHDGRLNSTLGAPNQGRSYELDCLAAYIDSLAVPLRRHTLTPAERRGKALFESPVTGCAKCHPAPLYTDHQTHDVGTANGESEWFGPRIDTPTLRFLYDSAPYLHDGSAATMRDVLTAFNKGDKHGVTSHLTKQEIEDLTAYLLSLPYQ